MFESRKLHICPKVTKMGSITGHRIDLNRVGALRGQSWPEAHIQQKLALVPLGIFTHKIKKNYFSFGNIIFCHSDKIGTKNT